MIGQLDHNLRRLYAEARTQKGQQYSKSTLLGFRHGIERYLNSPPYNKGLQLASDSRFVRSNQMLDAQLINLKRSGKENVTHKPAIEERPSPTAQSQWCLFAFFPSLAVTKCVVSYRSFLLPKRRRRTKSSDHKASTSLLMQPGESLQPWPTMKLPKTIEVVSMTNSVTRKKQESTKRKTKTMAKGSEALP